MSKKQTLKLKLKNQSLIIPKGSRPELQQKHNTKYYNKPSCR